MQFLRFAFEGVAYQYTVLPFGLSLAPRTFTKCIDAALSTLRQMGICILNYLDDWLILAQSEDELLSHRSFLLSHLECLGLRVNFAKSELSPSQRISFLGTVHDSAQMCLRVKVSQAYVAALAPWKDSQWMEQGVPLGVVYRRKVVSTDASNAGWGALCDGKPAFGLWSKEEGPLHINCLETLAVCFWPSHLSARPEGTPRFSPLGQHDGGVLYKLPGRSLLEAPLHSSRAPLGMGSAQLAFADSNACAGQVEP